MTKKHIGGDFDGFPRGEHLLDDMEAVGAKRVTLVLLLALDGGS